MTGHEAAALLLAHELEVDDDALRCLHHARCSCGLLYPAVTWEDEVRNGVLDARQREHVAQAVRS